MIKSLTKIKDFIPVFIACFFLVIISSNKGLSTYTVEGIKMYFATLFPTLFPYLFITTLLSFMRGTGKLIKKLSPIFSKVFKVNGACGYAYIMSLLSGYPVGSMLICELREQNLISEKEAENGAVLCSTSSPSFLIMVIGELCFSSTLLGLFLYLAHLLSSLSVGLIFCRRGKCSPSKFTELSLKKTDNVLYDSIVSSVNSILFVGGLITLFYLFTEILFSLGFLRPLSSLLSLILGNSEVSLAVTFGLFETTKGIKCLSLLPPSRLVFCVSAFLCGFSGVCVILQSIAYLKKAKIKTAPFLLSKATSAVFSLIYSFIFSLLLF